MLNKDNNLTDSEALTSMFLYESEYNKKWDSTTPRLQSKKAGTKNSAKYNW